MTMTVDIEQILDALSLDDLCGQVLSYHIPEERWNQEQLQTFLRSTLPGGVSVFNTNKESVEFISRTAARCIKIPLIVATDAENGPGGPVKNETTLPDPMSWGAADDEALIEQAGIATAEICRENGMHWNFAPVCDLSINPREPGSNIRCISSSPKQVARMARAYVRGLQKNGLMVAGAKHFPGEGVDDRNSHFCTTVNSLSMDQWWETYGYVYKEMIKEGVASIMVAHACLPAYQKDKPGEYEEILGFKPASLSKALMTDLLKGELGFDGCIMSDAMAMVGACSFIDHDKLAVEFLKCGGDMILYAVPEDFQRIKAAVLSGELPLERLKDAVRRVLRMKQKARLFEDQARVLAEMEHRWDIRDIAARIAEKSITLIRNEKNLFPLNLRKGDRILICNLQGKDHEAKRPGCYLMDFMAQDLRDRGFEVVMLTNAGHRVVEQELEKGCACVLLNCKLSCRDYKGGSLRAEWEHAGTFWRGRVLKHPKVIFTSFGDPYKLFEFPYVYTYINAYSSVPHIQKAFVRAILGEISFSGKSPVGLPRYFEREVD